MSAAAVQKLPEEWTEAQESRAQSPAPSPPWCLAPLPAFHVPYSALQALLCKHYVGGPYNISVRQLNTETSHCKQGKGGSELGFLATLTGINSFTVIQAVSGHCYILAIVRTVLIYGVWFDSQQFHPPKVDLVSLHVSLWAALENLEATQNLIWWIWTVQSQ